MFGAIYGDIIGSYYELHCTKNYDFEFNNQSFFTDDSVLTAAVCRAILQNPENINILGIKKRAFEYAVQYKRFYSMFPHAGFGQAFEEWAKTKNLYRQKSYGNGSAMRAVPIGYAFDNIKQVCMQAKASCLYTHNHPKSIKAAQSVACTVYLANRNNSKECIKKFIESKFGYNLSTPLKEIKKNFVFNSSSQYSVPPSIIAFLESEDYESAVRNAVSLGGDADTMACISGGIAEAFYKEIPKHIQNFCTPRIDITIKSAVKEFENKYQ